MKAKKMTVVLAMLMAGGLLAAPDDVSAQNVCYDCIEGVYPCMGCAWPADWGWDDCSPSCAGWCYVSSQQEDCVATQDEQELLAIASGTTANVAGGARAGEEFEGDGGWINSGPVRLVGDEVLLGQVTRDCKGFIEARYYPPAEAARLRKSSAMIVL
jgi:hypothetical protein